MKTKKIIACVVALAMATSFAGCSKKKGAKAVKVTADDLIEYAEDNDATEYDIRDLDEAPISELEDGIYSSFEGEDIKDYDNSIDDVLEALDLDYDDIDCGALYAKATGMEELSEMKEPDFEDISADVVVALQITLADEDLSEELIEKIDTNLEEYEIKDNLGKSEYTEGCLKVHLSLDDMKEPLQDTMVFSFLVAFADENTQDLVNEAMDAISGDICLEISIKEECIFIMASVSVGADADNISDLCSGLDISCPADLSANEELAISLIEKIDKVVFSQLGSIAG